MKQTSQRSLLFRQNVNRTGAEWRRVCPRQGGRGMRTRLRPRHAGGRPGASFRGDHAACRALNDDGLHAKPFRIPLVLLEPPLRDGEPCKAPLGPMLVARREYLEEAFGPAAPVRDGGDGGERVGVEEPVHVVHLVDAGLGGNGRTVRRRAERMPILSSGQSPFRHG